MPRDFRQPSRDVSSSVDEIYLKALQLREIVLRSPVPLSRCLQCTRRCSWLALRGASAGGFVLSTRGLATWARARLSRCLFVVLTRQPCASWSLLPRLVPSGVCRHDGQQGSQQVSQSSERPLVTGKHSRSAFTTGCPHAHTHTRAW